MLLFTENLYERCGVVILAATTTHTDFKRTVTANLYNQINTYHAPSFDDLASNSKSDRLGTFPPVFHKSFQTLDLQEKMNITKFEQNE